MKRRRGEKRNSELTELTSTLLHSLAFLTIIGWIVPAWPIVIACMFSLHHTYFLAVWFGGLPFLGILLYMLMKRQVKK